MPSEIDDLLNTAQAALDASDWDEAHKYAVQALKLDSGSTRAAELWIDADKAIKQINIDELLMRAEVALEDSDWDEAKEYAEQVLDLDAFNPEAAELLVAALEGNEEQEDSRIGSGVGFIMLVIAIVVLFSVISVIVALLGWLF